MSVAGYVIVGPGSEWFWSMLQFVIVAITLFGIYRQVRLQASAAAVQQMDTITRDWRSEATTRNRLAIEVAVRDGIPFDQVPYGPASTIGDFWEGIAYLARKGHLDFTLLIDNLGASALWWWTMLAPWTARVRVEARLPSALEDFEWLAGRVVEVLREEGDPTVYDQAHILATLDRRIENDVDRIRICEDLRAVVERSGSPAGRQGPRAQASPGSGRRSGRSRNCPNAPKAQ